MSNPSKPPRGGIAVGIVAVVLGALALLPGAFSPALAQTVPAPPPPPPAVVTITVVVNGNEETIATTPGGLATVILPEGSTVTGISLTVTTSPGDIAAPRAELAAVYDFVSNVLGGFASATPGELVDDGDGNVLLAYVFEVSFGPFQASNAGQMFVMDSATMLQAQPGAFLQTGIELPVPATGILNVLPETLAQAGGDLSRLSVYFVDPASGVFEPVTMLPSPGPGQIAFQFTKEGAYAILVNVISVDAVPAPANTGIPASTEADRTGTYALLAGTVLATIALGGLGLRFARRRA